MGLGEFGGWNLDFSQLDARCESRETGKGRAITGSLKSCLLCCCA